MTPTALGVHNAPSEPTVVPRMRRLWLVPLVLAAVGCSSMGALDPPQITLSDLEISEMTVFETSLVARLRVTNPNPEPLVLDGGSFDLILDGRKVGSGTVKESFTVERLDAVLVDATVRVSNATLVLRLKDVLEQQVVSYGIRGAFFTRGTFGTAKLRVDRTGTLDLSDLDRGRAGAGEDRTVTP